MTLRKIVATVLAGGLFASLGASAAEPVGPQPNQIYGTIGGLFVGEDATENLDSFGAGQVGFGVQLTDHFATEFQFGLGNSETDDRDVDIYYSRIDGLYDFGGETWRPYTVGGIGGINYDADNGGADGDVQLNVGAGVMRPITDRFRVRGDVRGFYSVDDNELAPGLTLGLQYVAFGPVERPDGDNDGVSDATDQCPGTPAGVQVDMNGCRMDDDGDGVMNENDACANTAAGVSVGRDGCPQDSDNDGVLDPQDACPNSPSQYAVDERGCTRRQESTERMEATVYFDFDKSSLRSSAESKLDDVVEFMQQNRNANAEVGGYTDKVGASGYNQNLSERRARSVREYLVGAGIEAQRIQIRGYGEADEAASTPEGRQQNRRATAVSVSTSEQPVRR